MTGRAVAVVADSASNVPPALATHIVHGKDAGWPGTRGVTYALPATGLIDAAPYYCTLAPLTQRL